MGKIGTSEDLKLEMSPHSAQNKSNPKGALKYAPLHVYNSLGALRRSLGAMYQ